MPESSNYNHHMAAILSADLIGNFDLDVGLIWDRIGDPQQDAAGNLPEADDFRLTVGVGWNF